MQQRARFCGIDIGSHHLKLVCRLEAGAHGQPAPVVCAVARAPGPAAERSAEAKAIGQALVGLCQQTGLATRWTSAAVSVPTSSMVVKVMHLPVLSPAERRAAFRLEMDRLLALAEGEAAGDYLPLASDVERHGAQESLLLLATREEAVREFRAMLAEAHLQPVAVEPEPAAQFRLARLLTTPDEEGAPHVLVDLGAAGTRMLVVQRGELLLFRDLPVGGSHLTAALSRHLGTEYAEAEELKCTRFQEESHPALEAESERLFKEIERSLRYVERERHLEGYGGLHLVGGGARWPLLRRVVERAVGIRARDEIRLPGGPVEPDLAQAVALAVWPLAGADPAPASQGLFQRVRHAVEGGLRR